MANDLSNPVPVKPVSGDGFFEHGAGSDSLFSTAQLAQANGAAAPQTIHVNPPQDAAAGPVVIRVEVTPGSIVELPQPFEADAALLAKEGDGNLAIRVGDVTVVLQGYIEANGAAPVTIEGADNQPIDIATILASTDPAIDIQTAAGPDAGQNGQGADNSGAILTQLEGGDGLGGFESAGAQDGTELAYRTIDNSIRNDFADPLAAAPDVFGVSVGAISGAFHEGFLRDPAQTSPFGNTAGTYFGTFLEEYRDAVEHPGQAMFAGWADFYGTAVTQNNNFDEYLSQTTQITTVDANFTGATGDLVLTGIGTEVKSNGSELHAEFRDDGHTMFLRRDDDNALVAVVHVDGPDANGHFVIETIMINRIDHNGDAAGDAGRDSMDIDIQFKVYDGPAPQQQEGPIEGGEGNDVPQGPTSPSIDGSFTASFGDDVPILEKITYQNQNDGSVTARSETGADSHIGLVDEDWLHGGAHDQGADFNSNAGANGDTGGGTCVTGTIQVNFGADGKAQSDGKFEEAGKHAFVLDTAQYHLGETFPYGENGLTSGGKTLVVLSVDGDHITVGIADEKQQQALVEGQEGDTSGEQPTDPTNSIPGCTIFTLTLDQDTGEFKFELKGPLDHGDSIFGDETGVSALAETQPEDTIPLQFGVKAYDDDGDWAQAEIDIDVNDDMPVARNDEDHVAEGSHDAISGNVMTGADTDAPKSGMDSEGADHALVVAIAAGDTTGIVGKEIQGQYGKLTLDADGHYTYTRDAYSPGGVDDVFTYTLKDGDGDTSTATLTIHIDNAGVTVALPSCPADTTVHEAGLPARDGEAAGSDAAADSEHTEGTITITAKDGIKSLEIGGDTLTLTELKDLGNHHHEIADSTGKLTLTGFDESTGALTYTYDLKDNTDANTTTSAKFDIKVTDVDDGEGTAQLVINIVDDEPTAACDELKVDAPKDPTADVQFILDISGSMRDQYVNIQGNTYPDNRIGLERYAVEQMLNAHPEIQNVQIVLFDDRSSRSEWMTRDEAIAWIRDGDNFDGQGGNTNYDKALDEAMKGIADDRPLPNGDQTLVYFFSDGNPNEPHNDPGITDEGNGASQVSIEEWEQFVAHNDISNVFAIGIGSTNHLDPIAYPNGAGGTEPNLISLSGPSSANLADLLGTLTDTIVPVVTPIHGDLTANDTPGADSFGDGKLVSVSYNGNTLDFTDNASTHHIDLGAGRGSIDFKGDGTYTYNPPAKNADGTPFYIEYTIQDGDGDTSTAKLKIDINTRPETDLNGASCEGADTNAGFVEDHGAIKIAPDGSVGDDDGQITSMTLTLTNHPDNTLEKLSLNTDAQNAADAHGLTVSAYNPSTGVLTISGPAAPASVYQTILQGIVYDNSSDTPNTTDRHVTVVVNDGTFNSVSHTVDIYVTPTNDAPTADITHGFAATEDQSINISGKVGNLANMVIGDPDSGNDDVYVTLKVTEGKLDVTTGGTGVSIVSGDNTDTVTIKGSVSEINNLLKETSGGSVKYIIENNSASGQVTLTLSVNDDQQNGQGGAKTASDTATIIITNVNDKPLTDLNGNSNGSDNAASFVEDGAAVKIAPNGTIKDDDSQNLTSMTVTLTNIKDGSAESIALNSAALGLASGAGLTVGSYNPANGVLTITGSASVATYQSILQNIVYNNSSDTPNTTDRNVTVVVNDGSLNSTSHTSTISVTPHNDAPTAVINAPGYDATEDSWVNLSGKISNVANMLIGDPDSANDDVYVTLSVTQGKLDVSVGNTGVTIVSGDNTDSVVIKGTVTEINNLLKESGNGSVKYLNDNNNPSAHVTLTLSVNDDGQNGQGGAQTASTTTTIDITAVNDKPVTDLNGNSGGSDNSASFVEDSPAVKIAPNGMITDVDSQNLSSMTVTLTNIKDGAAESLALNGAALTLVTNAGLTVTAYNSATGVLTITGSASVATYQSILQGILYNNSSDTPNTTSRNVTVVVSDGSLSSDSHTSTISVTPHNDAPTAVFNAPGYDADENQWINLSGKTSSLGNMVIGDPDSGNDDVYVTLSVTQGKLDVNVGTTGVTIVSGDNSASVQIKGSVAEINNLLQESGGGYVKYINTNSTPAAHVTLTLSVDDDGQNGTGGDQTASTTTVIDVTNIGEKPVTDLNGNSFGSDNSASYTEDASPVKIAPSGKITDTDSSNLASMTVTLTNIKDGALESLGLNSTAQTLVTNAGLTVTAYNSATGVLTISGSASVGTYQSILQNLVYDNDSQNPNPTTRSVTVVVNDGQQNSDSHTVSISVTPVNDAPDATISQSTYAAVEQTDFNLAGKGLHISDVDAGNGTITVWLQVGEGRIDITAGTTGVSIDDNHTKVVEITGTLTQINNLLDGNNGGIVNYYNDSNTPSASTTLKLSVNDEGNTGGGDQTDYATATITIQDTNEGPVAVADNIYTNAGNTTIYVEEWMLLRNDTDVDTNASKFDLVSVTNVSGFQLTFHNDEPAYGYIGFTDTNSNLNTDSKFDYGMTDGMGGSATGHVTVHQDTDGGTLRGTGNDDIIIAGQNIASVIDGGAGNDIIVGSDKGDKIDGGDGDDYIFGGRGNDTFIFNTETASGNDKYDGGGGFDRVVVTGDGQHITWSTDHFSEIDTLDLGDGASRDRTSNAAETKFSLDAHDLVGNAAAGYIGDKYISLWVIGDQNGNGNSNTGKDNVDLTNFTATNVTANVTDTTGISHNFTVYTGVNQWHQTVNVAVETGLAVTTH